MSTFTLPTARVLPILALISAAACTPYTLGEPIDDTLPELGALLVLDVQKDFMRPDGAYPVDTAQGERALKHINQLLQSQQDALDEGGDAAVVVFAKNDFRPEDPANPFRGNSAIRGSEGAELDDELLRIDAPLFSKAESDAFSSDDFDAHLRALEVTHVYLSGVYADGCVYATALAAQQRGYDVTIIEDAVATASDERLDVAFDGYQEDGFGVRTTEQAISALRLR